MGKNLKAVIDTNIVFAALANRNGAAFKILQRFFQRQFDWVNSPQNFDEYQGVLSISQKISPTSLQIFLHLLQKRSIRIQIANTLHVCKDPDDDTNF